MMNGVWMEGLMNDFGSLLNRCDSEWMGFHLRSKAALPCLF
jgi:hypothetical protein